MALEQIHPVISVRDIKSASPLSRDFYAKPPQQVAKNLLGKILVTQVDGALCAALIVEVETYLGAEDPASHAYRGPTKRNASMFGPGGKSYVYLSYGMHHCVNVVTGSQGKGEAVLLRAAKPLFGLETMAQRRKIPFNQTPKCLRSLASGPGKLTSAMGITLKDDGNWLDQPHFKIIDLGIVICREEIALSPRIGISKAVDLPLRFFVKNCVFVSKP